MRWHAKVDRNQRPIVEALRKAGAAVQSLAAVGGGVPDLLVWHRGSLALLEIKDPAGRERKVGLTPSQEAWHAAWPGKVHVVSSVEQALAAHAEKCPLCGHAAHTGPCPYRTADYYCDCGRPADAPIPEVIETATETKTKK